MRPLMALSTFTPAVAPIRRDGHTIYFWPTKGTRTKSSLFLEMKSGPNLRMRLRLTNLETTSPDREIRHTNKLFGNGIGLSESGICC
jgi:hypothetical protein